MLENKRQQTWFHRTSLDSVSSLDLYHVQNYACICTSKLKTVMDGSRGNNVLYFQTSVSTCYHSPVVAQCHCRLYTELNAP